MEMRGGAVAAVCLLLLAPVGTAESYEGKLHQQLTFLAAKQLNRCVDATDIPPLTPLEVRYVARANVQQAELGPFRRLFRWSYYDRAAQEDRSFLWFINTRLHGHFKQVVEDLEHGGDDAERYENLGRVVSYLQDMTSPAQVVPVYQNRWWRLSFRDRFNGFKLDEAAVERALTDVCAKFANVPLPSPSTLLVDTANDTIAAIRSPIDGLPATWEAFWEFNDDASDFGEYGVAGNNFGRQTSFRCGDRRCVLLDKDPLYRAFATQRHAKAVESTMGAMLWLQQRISAK